MIYHFDVLSHVAVNKTYYCPSGWDVPAVEWDNMAVWRPLCSESSFFPAAKDDTVKAFFAFLNEGSPSMETLSDDDLGAF